MPTANPETISIFKASSVTGTTMVSNLPELLKGKGKFKCKFMFKGVQVQVQGETGPMQVQRYSAQLPGEVIYITL